MSLDLHRTSVLTYLLDDQSSVKASYNRMYQYLHLMSNSTSGTPTDIWVPSSQILKPQEVDQIALGYYRNFNNNMFETSIEGYYKQMNNQTDFENGTDILLNPKLEASILSGQGTAYGMEVFLKKKRGKLTGWLSYTLAKTTYQFEEINGGKP